MLSIIIADDEEGIIDLVKMLIEYPEARVVGEARNSRELFEKIGELRPNTVITDICMPGMSGLELIEEAKEAYPDVNFIVMSGFAEFEYAQQAVRLGVLDYLLKPISQTELNRILQKLDEQLLENRLRESRQAGVQKELKESVGILREQYLLNVWRQGGEMEIPRVGEQPILELEGVRFQSVVFSVDSRFSARKVDAEMLMQKAEEVFAKARELESAPGMEGLFVQDGNMAVNLVLFTGESAEEKSRVLMAALGDVIRSHNHQNSFARLSAAASQILEGNARGVSEAFRQAEAAVRWRMEKTDSCVIPWSREEEMALERAPHLCRTVELQEAVATRNTEKLNLLLREAFERGAEVKVSGAVYRLTEEAVACVNEALGTLPGASEVPESMQIELFEILAGSWAMPEIALRIGENAERLLKRHENYFAQRENGAVLQAKQYISAHFAEELTLNHVARHVCLNPAYLSTLFKAETGLGFARYLQKVRVEEAKKLLKHTKMRVGDIAQSVGYRDVKSFNKIFFSETQVKPSQYRKFYM